MKKKFKDFKDLLKKYKHIDVNKYSSGTIYKAFNIKIKNHKQHNALHDVNSMYKVSQIILDYK